MTVTLVGYIDVPHEQLSQVRVALREHIRLTRAESGCLSFEVTPHATIDGRFDVREEFVDQIAFDHHQTRASASAWGHLTRDFKREYQLQTR